MIRYSLFLEEAQLAALRQTQKKAGVPVAEQIRRAIDSQCQMLARAEADRVPRGFGVSLEELA